MPWRIWGKSIWRRRRKSYSRQNYYERVRIIEVGEVQAVVWCRVKTLGAPAYAVTLQKRYLWTARGRWVETPYIDNARLRHAVMALELAEDWIAAQPRRAVR